MPLINVLPSHFTPLSPVSPCASRKWKKRKIKKKEQGAGGTKVRWEVPASPLMWYKIAGGVQQERSMLSAAPIPTQASLPGRTSCPWHLYKTNLMAQINSAWESGRHRSRSQKKKKKKRQVHYTDTLLSSWKSGIWSSVSVNWVSI